MIHERIASIGASPDEGNDGAESRVDIDELPAHHRQAIGVGQGSSSGSSGQWSSCGRPASSGITRASGSLK